MSEINRYNILIIDPESSSRGRLKQAALALTTFNQVFTVSTLAEAAPKTEGREPIDIVVFSYRFSSDDINRFINHAKRTTRGQEWAFMTVIKPSDKQNEAIADSVVHGIDGFLLEPYSADNLREMAEITANVKKKNELVRKKAALLLLLKEISGHIDAVAFYRSIGREPIAAMRRLQEGGKRLSKFSNEIREIYIEAAIEVFCEAVPPDTSMYHGVSQRVREKLESNMLRKLEEKYS